MFFEINLPPEALTYDDGDRSPQRYALAQLIRSITKGRLERLTYLANHVFSLDWMLG